MPLEIIRGDIGKIRADAIVSTTNWSKVSGRTAGSVKIAESDSLSCKYIIYTQEPKRCGEQELLESCYREALQAAKEHDCETVAFPLISSGACGDSEDRALKVAVNIIGEFLLKNDITVYLIISACKNFRTNSDSFFTLTQYVDERYCDECFECLSSFFKDNREEAGAGQDISASSDSPKDLDEKVRMLDESFSEMLLRMIDEKGMKDSECYKKANIDRKLFSKIRSDVHYTPSKPTVLAFAIALELTLEEAKDMLMKAGFAFSHSNKFDVIVEYFITTGNYNIFEINEALFRYDQKQLGG